MDLSASLSRNRFAVIGRVGMDFYADPPATRIEAADRFMACIGGSSANIAVAITRHGGQASLITSVADDAVGRFCLERLAGYGVDCRHVRTIAGEARNSLSVVDTCGDATQAVIYRNGAADFAMTTADIDAVDLTGFGAMITTGTVLAAEPSRSAALHALERAKRDGLALIFDLDYRPYSWPTLDEASTICAKAAAMCDVVVGNDVEFGVLAGHFDDGLDAARALAGSTAAVVIYKRGEKGAITITDDDEFRTGIYRVDALKPTGAGDGFMGGFVAALAAGHDLREAVLRGSASAAIVVTRVGCAPAMPTTDELDRFLASHPCPADD